MTQAHSSANAVVEFQIVYMGSIPIDACFHIIRCYDLNFVLFRFTIDYTNYIKVRSIWVMNQLYCGNLHRN